MKMSKSWVRAVLTVCMLMIFVLPVAALAQEVTAAAAAAAVQPVDTVTVAELTGIVLDLWPSMDWVARVLLLLAALYFLVTQFIAIGRRVAPEQFDKWTWDEWFEEKLGPLSILPKTIIGFLTANYGNGKRK